MTIYNIREFKIEDLYNIDVQEMQKDEYERTLNRKEMLTNCFTVEVDNKIIFIGGFLKEESYYNIYYGWMLLSKDAKKYFTFLIRSIKNIIKNNLIDADRIYILCNKDFKEALRLAEILGFNKELNNYYVDNKTYLMYSVDYWLLEKIGSLS